MIDSVLLQLVQYMDVSSCNNFDTFAVISTDDEFSTPNLGKTPTDAKNGHFWSRYWASSGFPADKLVARFPMLLWANGPVSYKVIDAFDGPCFTGMLIVGVLPDCQYCPPECRQTPTQARIWQRLSLGRIMRDLTRIIRVRYHNGSVAWLYKDAYDKAKANNEIQCSLDMLDISFAEGRELDRNYQGGIYLGVEATICRCVDFNSITSGALYPTSPSTKCSLC